MTNRYKSTGEHPCKIELSAGDPNDCWPSLTPRANICQKFIRALRRYTLPSYVHPDSKYVYKSIYSFRAEKNRMIYNGNPFILHPFSILAMIRLISFFFLMLVYFITHTYSLYFRLFESVTVLGVFLKVIQVFFILTGFMVGYVEEKDNQITVILSQKEIALYNLRRYFCIDIMELLRVLSTFIEYETVEVWINFIIFHIFIMSLIHRFFISCNDSVGDLLHNILGTNNKSLDVVSFLTLIAFCVHYLTCFRYGMPKMINTMGGGAILPPSQHQLKDYMYYCHSILIILYKTSVHFQRDKDDYYEIVECFTRICVAVLHVYIAVYVLVSARNTNKSKYKYGIMWNNIQAFLKNRKISGKLRFKILAHYQHKFQYQFFEEAYIIDSLSNHLQYECQLHTCSHLIANTTLLKGLPKAAVGRIVAALKPIVYLPNDVIINWQSAFDGIYIVSYGTVALYIDQGKEMMHLEDGGVIGADGYYLGTNYFTTTSVTITEVYKLDIPDLDRIAKQCPDFSLRLKIVGINRMKMAKEMTGEHITKLVRHLDTDGRKLRYEQPKPEEFVFQDVTLPYQ